MNFKLKALFAATVLAVSATSANAAIETGQTTGNSELVFSAWDINTGIGYTYDLLSALTVTNFIGADTVAQGTNLNNPTLIANNQQMLANAVLSTSFVGAGGTILDTALTGIPFGANIADVKWNLSGNDDLSRRRLVTTVNNASSASGVSNSQISNASGAMTGYYTATNSFVSPAPGADTFITTVEADGQAYAGLAGIGWANNLFNTTNSLGDSSFLYLVAQVTQSSSSASALFKQLGAADGGNIVVSTYQQAGQWRLNLSSVPVAAVPEPETYAMFLAGLGIMGAVARRRKGQVK